MKVPYELHTLFIFQSMKTYISVYWQKDRKKTYEYHKEYQYWQDRLVLDKMEPLNLPFDTKPKVLMEKSGRRHRFYLKDGLLPKIKCYIDRMNVTSFIFYHACLTILLQRYTDTNNITIGTSIAGRNHSDLLEMAGLFVNTIPIYTELNPDYTFNDYLSRNKELILDDISNGEFQYDEIVKLAYTNDEKGRGSLFNVFLVVQELRLNGLTLGQNVLTPYPVNNFTAKFDLNFEINITDNDQYFVIEYPRDNFEYDTIRGMADSFCTIVEQVILSPDIKISRISLAAGEHMPIKEQSPENGFAGKDIITLFEDQVMVHPYHIALEWVQKTVSYKDLNHFAERIAAYLYDKLENEEAVAVVCERSIFMIACVLGILKAGGAYLPIDPAYPADRIQYMLKDCNVSLS